MPPTAWIPVDEWKTNKRLMLDALPEDKRPDWSDRLPSAYRQSLRERLDELCQSLAPVAEYLKMDADFVKAVVDTRNYYHHWSSGLEAKCMSPNEMGYAMRKLRVLLESLLMLQAGFSHNEVLANVKKNSRVKEILNHPPRFDDIAILDD
jgi:hypothetical protein